MNETLPQPCVGRDGQHGPGHAPDVSRVAGEHCLARDLRQAPPVGAEHRDAVVERLHNRQAESFQEREEEKRGRPAIEGPHPLIRNEAKMADGEARGLGGQRVPARRVTGQYEVHRAAARGDEPPEGLEDTPVVLVRPEIGRKEEIRPGGRGGLVVCRCAPLRDGAGHQEDVATPGLRMRDDRAA